MSQKALDISFGQSLKSKQHEMSECSVQNNTFTGKPALQVMRKVDDQCQLILASDVISAAKLNTIRDLKELLCEKQSFVVDQ
jgi:hypothetical protein